MNKYTSIDKTVKGVLVQPELPATSKHNEVQVIMVLYRANPFTVNLISRKFSFT